MPRLFSYVVQHGLGFAPNPFGGFFSLAKCKFSDGRRRNIVELAEEGDWIAGTGGADRQLSAGHGRLNYAMRVDDKIPLANYFQMYGETRIDANLDCDPEGRYVLLSRDFYYFGRNAILVSKAPRRHLTHPFEMRGPSHRSDFTEEFVEAFAAWIGSRYQKGIHGPPCSPQSDHSFPKCPHSVRH